MATSQDVKPQRWSNLTVLYDQNGYSVAVGNFRNDAGETVPALGERWNGSGDSLGFPNQSGHPIWHVVPEFLVGPVLRAILDESLSPRDPERDQRVRSTLESLIARRAA